jgi:hypothetical protein
MDMYLLIPDWCIVFIHPASKRNSYAET